MGGWMDGCRSLCTAREASPAGRFPVDALHTQQGQDLSRFQDSFSYSNRPLLEEWPHSITFKQRHKHGEDSTHLSSCQAHRQCPAPSTATADVRAVLFHKNIDPALRGSAELYSSIFGLSKFRPAIIQIMSIQRNKTQRCTEVQSTVFSNPFFQ